MARPLDKESYKKKRNDILDVVLELIYAKGYDQFSVQDVRERLGISSGAFHHYFKSRSALLEALVDRIKSVWIEGIHPIVSANETPAINKLQEFLAAFNEPRNQNKAAIAEILQGWYSKDNDAVRQRIDEAKREVYVPLLATIIRQGKQEGVFSVTSIDATSSLVIAVLQNMELTYAQLLLAPHVVTEEDLLESYSAHIEAIERILGIPAKSLHRISHDDVKPWLEVMK